MKTSAVIDTLCQQLAERRISRRVFNKRLAALGILERDEPRGWHRGLARIGDQRGDHVVLPVRVAQHLEVALVEKIADEKQHRAAR